MIEQKIGVIADTHGLLRPEAIRLLHGSSLIIHAGDIGKPEILETLKLVAPVVAVRGNVDTGTWCRSLPLSAIVEVGNNKIHVLHEISHLDLDPGAEGLAAVIFGHSHQPSLEAHQGVIFLNPGSAGPRRFKLPVSLAVIEVKGNTLSPKIVELAEK